MIGVFDSGVGGYNALYELRRCLPRCDILYLADRENAPYGTKERDEVLRLVKRNIRILKERGASHILIACCTASALYPELKLSEREISLPIIAPAARVAAEGERIAVIATERTVRERAFSEAIKKIRPDADVTELAAQVLVGAVEAGARDGSLTPSAREALDRICGEPPLSRCDTLVLGCTHFSHLEAEFCHRLPWVRIVSPAKIGAAELAKEYRKQLTPAREGGRIIYM